MISFLHKVKDCRITHHALSTAIRTELIEITIYIQNEKENSN